MSRFQAPTHCNVITEQGKIIPLGTPYTPVDQDEAVFLRSFGWIMEVEDAPVDPVAEVKEEEEPAVQSTLDLDEI